jgi:hypothetical protein
LVLAQLKCLDTLQHGLVLHPLEQALHMQNEPRNIVD